MFAPVPWFSPFPVAEGSYCPPPNLAHRTLRDFPPFTSHTKVFHLKSTNSPCARTQSNNSHRDVSRNFHHASSHVTHLHRTIVVVVPPNTNATAHSNLFSAVFRGKQSRTRLPQLGHGASDRLEGVVSPSIVRSYVERNAMCVTSPIPYTLHAISCKGGEGVMGLLPLFRRNEESFSDRGPRDGDLARRRKLVPTRVTDSGSIDGAQARSPREYELYSNILLLEISRNESSRHLRSLCRSDSRRSRAINDKTRARRRRRNCKGTEG